MREGDFQARRLREGESREQHIVAACPFTPPHSPFPGAAPGPATPPPIARPSALPLWPPAPPARLAPGGSTHPARACRRAHRVEQGQPRQLAHRISLAMMCVYPAKITPIAPLAAQGGCTELQHSSLLPPSPATSMSRNVVAVQPAWFVPLDGRLQQGLQRACHALLDGSNPTSTAAPIHPCQQCQEFA